MLAFNNLNESIDFFTVGLTNSTFTNKARTTAFNYLKVQILGFFAPWWWAGFMCTRTYTHCTATRALILKHLLEAEKSTFRKESTFRKDLSFHRSETLNVYTGQNPRQHVVLKNTSQMRTMCTQTGRNLSACLYLYVSYSPEAVV